MRLTKPRKRAASLRCFGVSYVRLADPSEWIALEGTLLWSRDEAGALAQFQTLLRRRRLPRDIIAICAQEVES